MLALAALLVADPSCEAPGPEVPGSAADREYPERVTALVTDVVDGDTVEVMIDDGRDGRAEEVRYIGVDTPETVDPDEPVQCFGPESSSFNRSLVGGRRVTLVFDAELRDKYERLLAYVYLGERSVNAALVHRGLARTLTIPPNDSFATRFERLERSAARSGRGLWGACAM